MKRSKAAYVMKKIAEVLHNSLITKLRSNKFSIIVDEASDITTSKNCCAVCKFYGKSNKCISTQLLDLLDVNKTSNDASAGSTGENLYRMLMDYFQQHGIPIDNLTGFASDGASNMMGAHNSLTSRLKLVAPNITVFRCICHSAHLCASQAAKTLPRMCEDLVRNIYTFFNQSAKRKCEFQQFQHFCDVKPHKILHVSQTRWLSLHMAVSRTIEQWEPLQRYFREKYQEDKLTSLKLFVDGLNDPAVHFYYQFLNFILPKFTEFNKLFQRAEPTIHLLYDASRNLYLDVLRCFYRPDRIN